MRKNITIFFSVSAYFIASLCFAASSNDNPIVPELKNGASPTIVWQPQPPTDYSTLFNACVSAAAKVKSSNTKQKAYLDCLTGYMKKHNASPQAIAFTKASEGAWATSFKQYGNISVVMTEIIGADYQNRYFIITPEGEVIDTMTDHPSSRVLAKQLPAYATLLKKYPGADTYDVEVTAPVLHKLYSGEQQLVFDYRIATCHACDTLAILSLGFNFTSAGTPKGVQALSLQASS